MENPLRKVPLNSVYVREHMKQRYAKLISNDRLNLSLRIKDYYSCLRCETSKD